MARPVVDDGPSGRGSGDDGDDGDDVGSGSGAPRPRPRHRRSVRQRLLIGAVLTMGGVVLVGVAIALFVFVKLLGIERIGNLGTDDVVKGEPRNYLVVGSDKRDAEEGESQRSDTVMVVRIDPDEEEAAVLSIPRDLMVPIAGTGRTNRINSAYSIGRDTLVDTIRDAFGIELHHYVEIDFSSFENLVDSAGGVSIWTETALKDDGSGLYVPELGCVELDGEQALAFVRSRHLQYMTSDGTWSAPDPTADLGRIERQQVFMRLALAEAISQAKSNPARIPQLVDRGVGAVAVDESLSVGDLLDLADRARKFDADELRTYSLPVVERGDGATVAVDTESAEPILDYFRGLADATEDESESGSSTTESDSGAKADENDDENDEADDEAEGSRSGTPESASNLGSDEFRVGEPPDGESC